MLFLLQQEKAHETELVGGVLAAKHRQLQFADQQVPHLVHQGELGVGHGEAHRFHRQLGAVPPSCAGASIGSSHSNQANRFMVCRPSLHG